MREAVNTLQSAANQAIPFEQRTEMTAEDLEKNSLPLIQEVWSWTESGMVGVPVKEVLAAPDLLPGFELPVSKIFEGIPTTPRRQKFQI